MSIVFFINIDIDPGLQRSLLPALALRPRTLAFRLQLVAARAQLGNSLLREQFLQRPLFDILALVLLELRDESDGTAEDAAFVLLAAWDDFGELVDAFVDGFAPAAFDCGIVSASDHFKCSKGGVETDLLCDCRV